MILYMYIASVVGNEIFETFSELKRERVFNDTAPTTF